MISLHPLRSDGMRVCTHQTTVCQSEPVVSCRRLSDHKRRHCCLTLAMSTTGYIRSSLCRLASVYTPQILVAFFTFILLLVCCCSRRLLPITKKVRLSSFFIVDDLHKTAASNFAFSFQVLRFRFSNFFQIRVIVTATHAKDIWTRWFTCFVCILEM